MWHVVAKVARLSLGLTCMPVELEIIHITMHHRPKHHH